MAGRAYKTLPSAFRKDEATQSPSQRRQHQNRSFGHSSSSSSNSSQTPPPSTTTSSSSSSSSSEGRLFGLNLHLGFSNLISGGMNLLGQLRRKAPLSAPSTSPTFSYERPILSTDDSTASTSILTRADTSITDVTRSQMPTELIELTSFAVVPLAEGEHEEQTGQGHQFEPITTFNPTWCDLCRDLIWGLYDTGGLRCSHCDLTCHEKCRRQVRLNCSSFERGLTTLKPASRRNSSASSSSSSTSDLKTDHDESTLANISTIRDEEQLNEEVDDGVVVGDDVVVEDDDDIDDDVGTLKNPNIEDFSPDVEPLSPTLAERLLDEDPSEVQDCAANILARVPPANLERAIVVHNADFPAGQETIYNGGQHFQGFIRVQLNLRRPINVLPGTRPPSVYTIKTRNNKQTDTLGESSETLTNKDRTLTSFYLPSDTFKVLHVESETTTADVIRNLLKKFRIVDNPHKFALYVKNSAEAFGRSGRSGSVSSTAGGGNTYRSDSLMSKNTLGRVRMRRLNDDEHPLLLALLWRLEESPDEVADGDVDESKPDQIPNQKVLVLQENDPGEIVWDSFSFPELKNFLRFLDREEAWYKKRIHEKYDFLHTYMQDLINKKREEAAAASVAISGQPS